ncbi:MAG: hypothetical protein HY055_08055 [Magnetospirillum sp.]|nr:hypothetical protein [Magnetospirillum sp.]
MTASEHIYSVLFISDDGAVRAPIAAALLNAVAKGRWRASHAVIGEAAPLHPLLRDALATAGAQAPDGTAPNWAEALANGQGFDFIFILAEAKEGVSLPGPADTAVLAHWPIPRPNLAGGTQAEHSARLAEIIRMIRRRIDLLMELPATGLDRLARQRHAESIHQRAD